MIKTKKLVLIGDGAFAEVAYEYFTHDSPYEVVGFSVEKAFLKRETLFGLPVVPFEEIEGQFPPGECEVFAALVYTQLNRLRARLVAEAKAKGYALASYVSSHAFVWSNVKMGEHCFIFENNVVQPFVTLGNNVILWSGNHIGHHSAIGDHSFISSHVVISGFVDVGSACFLGVNATLINNIKIAPDCWIGPSVTMTRDTLPGQFFKPGNAEPARLSTYDYFKLSPDQALAPSPSSP
jgi:sugar O-acyltransferase (sialic acid O-acetyltransferase NeuD family)